MCADDSQVHHNFTMQVTEVNRPLMSVSRAVDASNRVVFDEGWSYIEDKRTGLRTTIQRRGGLYVLESWVKARDEMLSQPFGNQPNVNLPSTNYPLTNHPDPGAQIATVDECSMISIDPSSGKIRLARSAFLACPWTIVSWATFRRLLKTIQSWWYMTIELSH